MSPAAQSRQFWVDQVDKICKLADQHLGGPTPETLHRYLDNVVRLRFRAYPDRDSLVRDLSKMHHIARKTKECEARLSMSSEQGCDDLFLRLRCCARQVDEATKVIELIAGLSYGELAQHYEDGTLDKVFAICSSSLLPYLPPPSLPPLSLSQHPL
ncbi:hypothetical protein V5O48_002351 [Marasmius crinis-equi]|uniref:Uncharacterized protein n=1 Tax=Marasmius crinis-equi TaxID=585013 RepID=A0ABR3FVX0_9AGAR